MAKRRVSIKGKGADLFFGDLKDDDLGVDDVQIDSRDVPVDNAPLTVPENPSPPSESEPMVEQDSPDLASTPSNGAMPSKSDEFISVEILDTVWPDVNEKATVTNAFRYTNHELSLLADTIYELSKQHGMRITKQEVARLGLNVVLADYQIRRDESILGEFVERRRRQRL